MQMYPQAIIGFRFWRVTGDGQLKALYHESYWPADNQMRSNCAMQEPHLFDTECSCGVYAYHDVRYANQCLGKHRMMMAHREVLAIGIIAARGEIAVYHDGFRAPEATVLALAAVRPRDHQQIQLAADNYGVPVIGHHQLHVFARQYGPRFDMATLQDPLPPLPTPPADVDIRSSSWSRAVMLVLLLLAVAVLLKFLFDPVAVSPMFSPRVPMTYL